jgi:hypothetical protein
MSAKIRLTMISTLILAGFSTMAMTSRASLNGRHDDMAQRPDSKNESVISEGFRLSIKLDKEEVKQGDAVFLSVTIQNVTGGTLYLFDSHPEKDYKISIVDAQDNKPLLTDRGRQLLDRAGSDYRRVRVKVLPGQEMHYKIEISRFYDLLLDNTCYITVNRQVFKMGTLDQFADVSSNTVTLSIVR